jgi:hypothetical protein
MHFAAIFALMFFAMWFLVFPRFTLIVTSLIIGLVSITVLAKALGV